jgi:two-component system, NarL family, response regulator
MGNEGKIRVLFADDHPVARAGLYAMIHTQSDMEVVGQASNSEEIVDLFDRKRPDVVVIDLQMPKRGGVAAITDIVRKDTHARILVLTTYDGDANIRQALKAGARGYLLKDATFREQLLAAIRRVHSGQKIIPPEVAAKLAENIPSSDLSERELQVLSAVAQGKKNREIAEAFGVTEDTIKGHVSSVMSKLNAADRTDAVVIALRRGLLKL